MEAGAAQVRADPAGALGRAGLLATAALYTLLGLLALRVALEGRAGEHRPDTEGALQLVADQPLGAVVLALLGLGIAAQAVWRLVEAFADRDNEGDDPPGLAKRLGYGAVALWYAGLAGLTAAVLFGHRPQNEQREREAAQGVLGWPFGRELVMAAGLGFIVAAVASVVFVWRRKHLAKLHTEQMAPETKRLASFAGIAGYTSRAVVFGVIGGFLIEAALDQDSSATVGLDGALLRLAQAPLGPLLLAAVALGFGCYGLWAALQARYRAT
jgi:hypothetical protein